MTKQMNDRPAALGIGDPRANCGCLTYFIVKRWSKSRWVAKHEDGCARRPIRRREAIKHTKAKS